MDTPDDIAALLAKLGGPDEYPAMKQLRAAVSDVPAALLAHYRTARGWRVRLSCVFFSLSYATSSDTAVSLALSALRDRSRHVRYRACMLLAYAQREDTLPALRDALATMPAGDPTGDLAAAIDAVTSHNHNYFVDRNHTGRVTMSIAMSSPAPKV